MQRVLLMPGREAVKLCPLEHQCAVLSRDDIILSTNLPSRRKSLMESEETRERVEIISNTAPPQV